VDSIDLYSEKAEKLKSVQILSPASITGVYEYKNLFVASYIAQGKIFLLNALTLDAVHVINLDVRINCVYFNAYHFVVGTVNNSMHVFDIGSGQDKYVLLGGSMNPKTLPKSFVHNPVAVGCSMAIIDCDRIVGVFGNLIRVYHFDLDN
jgi:hypothetical protein